MADENWEVEKERTKSTAVLYGLFALVVTLVVAAGIFFGGRAVYRALNGDSNSTSDVSKEESTGATKQDTASESSDSSDSTNSSSSSDSTNSSSSDASNNSTQSKSKAGSMPSTGDQPEDLPHTGDPGL